MRIRALVEFQGGSVAQVAPTDTIDTANNRMADLNIGALAVTSGDLIVGMISERDVARGIARDGVGVLQQPVDSIMSTKLVTCSIDTPVRDVTRLLCDNKIRHIPVMDGDRLVGMASIRDILGSYVERVEAEYDAMQEQLDVLTES